MTESVSIVVVAKTKMYADACVGALSEDGKRSLRLLTRAGGHQPLHTLLEIGQRWRVVGRAPDSVEPPHLEDFHVERQERIGMMADLNTWLLGLDLARRGPPQAMFDGLLQRTLRGRGYLSERSLFMPQYSTCLWLPSRDLTLLTEDSKPYYCWAEPGNHWVIPYVGFSPPVPRLLAGELLRMSLARWWKPKDADEQLERRCYLQLSGWYEPRG
jgi:hypothetical protein